jgi:hypothetical protein
VREGLVAGLEPFIDTIVVCTFTALIILATGIWNRGPDVMFATAPDAVRTESGWQYEDTAAPDGEWQDGEIVTLVVEAGENAATGQPYHRIDGVVTAQATGFVINWDALDAAVEPEIVAGGLYRTYVGATLTAKALDSVAPGLGKWLITVASWLFGISTIIAWAYYGEQGTIYLAGDRGILTFKLVDFQTRLLRPDISRNAGTHTDRYRSRQHDGHRARRHGLGQPADLLDIRLPGNASIQRLCRQTQRWPHGAGPSTTEYRGPSFREGRRIALDCPCLLSCVSKVNDGCCTILDGKRM